MRRLKKIDMTTGGSACPSPAANPFARAPYANAFDIGYPQENLDGEMRRYRCRHYKRTTTEINGLLENHAEDCACRVARQRRG